MTFSKEKTSKAARDYLHRLKNSLALKGEIELPEVALIDADELVRKLCAIEKQDWWKYAFSREPLDRIFCDRQRQAMYCQAVCCGEQMAREFRQQHPGIVPSALALKLGLKIEHPEIPQNSHHVLFAQFAEQGVIRIFTDGINKGRQLQESLAPSSPLKDVSIDEVLTAHELFHFIELENPSIWTRSYRVTLWKLGFIKNTSPVFVLSEIAAMAFAAEFCNLDFSPFVLDAFLVYGYSPKAGSALFCEMLEAAGSAASQNTQPSLACS